MDEGIIFIGINKDWLDMVPPTGPGYLRSVIQYAAILSDRKKSVSIRIGRYLLLRIQAIKYINN